jgi:hypothetical protein
MDPRMSDLLDEALVRGVITPEQREHIERLAVVRTPGRTEELVAWAREVPRGFNAITVAYSVGALAVIFALGWFMADRWTVLGPGGVLAASLLYMAVFGGAARLFTRERFPTAHGVAMILIVLTVPLVMWSALRVSGIWTEASAVCSWNDRPFWDCRSRVVVLAAVAFVSVLLSMRRLRFGPIMVPGAVALTVLISQVALEVSRAPNGAQPVGWPLVFTASVLVAIAYEMDRRRHREDYAGWLHIAAAICAALALVDLFGKEVGARHLLLPTAIAAMIASLLLHRLVWLVLGLGSLFAYLTWLATSVFRQAVAFPVILATVGITLMLLTVWVQRSYPRLAARVREANGTDAYFPGGMLLLLAPALVAVLMFPSARDAASTERAEREAEARRAQRLASPPPPVRQAVRLRPPPDTSPSAKAGR